MSNSEHDDPKSTSGLLDETTSDETTQADADMDEPKRKLELDVQISDVGPCRKHLKVTIPRGEIERQFEDSLGNVKREAFVPGFRPGRAPAKLVQRRYRKEVGEQVKSALLTQSLEQIEEDHHLKAISQPKLDLEAIELPEDGPMRFEMEVEVQPDFTLPPYTALKLKRPVREVSEADVDAQLKSFLERRGQLVPKFEGGAELGDMVTADLSFHLDGAVQNEAKEVQFRLQPEMRFRDGRIPKLFEALSGVKPGESREAEVIVGSVAVDPNLRSRTIAVTILVHDLKTLRLPELNAEFLAEIGFLDVASLRDALSDLLERRHKFQERQALRKQVLDALLATTHFDLPAGLVERERLMNLRRQVEEMRQSGFNDDQIRAREAELRANAQEMTLQSLKEFFVLSRIAEAEKIKVDEEDFIDEIDAIAARTDESPRRVRARIEKEDLADTIFAQILERKTLDRVLETAHFEDVMTLSDESQVETMEDASVTGATVEDQDRPIAVESESATPGDSVPDAKS